MSFINKINDSSAVNSARQFLNTPAKKAVAIVVALAVIVLLGVLLLKGCCCCRKPRPTPPSPTPSSARAAVTSNLAANRFGSTASSTSATGSDSRFGSTTHSTISYPSFSSSSSLPLPLPADPRFRNSSYVEVPLTPTFTEHVPLSSPQQPSADTRFRSLSYEEVPLTPTLSAHVPYSEQHQRQFTLPESLFSDGFSEFSSTFGFDDFIQPSHSSPHHGEETDLSSIILTRDFLSNPVPQELTEAPPLLSQDETPTTEPSSSDGINWVLISEGVEEATVLGADGVEVKRLRHASGEEWEKRPLDPKKSKSHGITGSWIRIKDADQKALTATSTEAQVQPAAVLELFAAINQLSEEGGPNDHVTASPVMVLAKQLSSSNLARPSTSGSTS